MKTSKRIRNEKLHTGLCDMAPAGVDRDGDPPLWVDNLSEWILDENRVITAKFVSRALRTHINTAKQRLFHFWQLHKNEVDEQRQLEVVLLLSGRDGGGRRSIRLVKESEAAEKEAKCYSSLSSKHVYALAKKAMLGPNGLTLAAVMLQTAREEETEPHANLGAVFNKAAVPRRRRQEDVKVESSSVTAAPVEPKKPVEEKTQSTGKKTKADKGGAIAGMFAKVAAKKVDTKKKRAEEDDSPGKENRLNEAKERDDSVKTKSEVKKSKKVGDGGSGGSSTAPKRKRIQVGFWCNRQPHERGSSPGNSRGLKPNMCHKKLLEKWRLWTRTSNLVGRCHGSY